MCELIKKKKKTSANTVLDGDIGSKGDGDGGKEVDIKIFGRENIWNGDTRYLKWNMEHIRDMM